MPHYVGSMGTMNISLPDSLKAFVEAEVARGGYSTSSEYVRELIRRELDRARLRALVLEGGASPEDVIVNEAYFQSLHARIDALRPE
jgi:antitoxin ParD1/3/4